MSFLTKSHILLLGSLLLFGGCASPHEKLKRSPSGVCWRVNLQDGFSNGDELIDTFSCLNHSGTFHAFSQSVTLLHEEDRNGTPLKESAAQFLNHSFDQESIQIFPILEELIQHHDDSAKIVSDVALLMLYGTLQLDTAQSTRINTQGIISSGLSLLPGIAENLLDEPDNLETLINLTQKEAFSQLFCTLSALEEQSVTQELMHRVPFFLGTLLEEIQNHENDQWSQATGNSFSDLSTHLLTGAEPPLFELSTEIHILASDTRIRTPIRELFRDSLHPNMLSSLKYLISVDAQGDPRTGTEPSALAIIVDVMHQSNQPLNCSFDIFSIPITSISIDNLASELLFRISNQDPQSIESAIDLLSILDLGISQWMLDLIVESEVCPILTSTFVDNLNGLQRLGDEPVEPLLAMGIELLKILRHPNESRIPEFANLLAALHSTQTVDPLEELLHDIVDHEILRHFLEITPTLSTLEGSCAQPIEFHAFMQLLADMTQENSMRAMIPLLAHLVEQEQFTSLLNRSAPIFQEAAFQKLVPLVFDLTPNISFSLDPENTSRALLVLEHQDLNNTLLNIEQEDPPLYWMGTFFLEDTLEELHALLSWLNERLAFLTEE